MKLTKKQETEIWQVYDTWLNSYLNGDVETYDLYLDDDYHFIGSTDNEEYLNRKDTTEFFADTAEQFAGKCELKKESRTLEEIGELIFITHLFDAWFLNGKDLSYYGRFRFTNALKKNKEGWRFIYQHFSIADSNTDDGETIGLDKVNSENQELREAIKRRTVELEKKNQELEIEVALEKVRARTMAMQHSDELQETSFLLDEQIRALGIKTWGCAFNIYGENESTEWFGNEAGVLHTYTVPRKGIFKEYYQYGQNGESLLIKEFSGDACIAHYDYMSTLPVIGDVLKTLKETNDGFPKYQIDHAVYFKYGYLLFITREHVPDAHDIFKRFAKVFEQTYTRFLDLQKAEAQAKEAQIETALERVRSRTMAMQNSEELEEVILEVLKKFQDLGISMEHRATAIFTYEDGNKDYKQWVASPEYNSILSFLTPYVDHPVQNDIWNARQNGTEFYAKSYTVEEKNSLFTYLFNLPALKNMPQTEKTKALQFEHYGTSMAFQKHAALVVVDHSGIPLTEAENSVLNRLAKVFNQMYTRFLDLQKAEEQAKEAQIEHALEKVRSRTMAMQNSSELPEAANNLFLQVQELGIPAWSAGYCIWEDNQKSASCNMSSEGEIQKSFSLPTIGEGYNFYKPLKNKEPFHVAELGSKKLVKHYDFMKTLPGIGEVLKEFAKKGIELPTFQIFHIVYFTHGYLMFITYEAVPNDWDVFKRFGKVFEQTFTRFLDLQKAEAQTREAQINLAVERVRARALAMHKSEEILEVVAKLKDEVMALDIPDVIAATIFLNEGEDKVRMWDLSTLEKDSNGYQIPFDITFKLKKKDPNLYVKRVWDNSDDYFLEVQEAKDLKRIVAWLRENNKDKIANEVEDYTKSTKLECLHHAVKKLNNGKLVIDLLNLPSDEMEIILTKMGAAFDLAYKRFEDLQKAEAQTREAQIETALEKVRSRSLAMHKPEELQEVVATVAEKLKDLGVIFDAGGVILCTYFPDSKDVVHWIAVDDFSSSGRYFVPYFDNPIFSEAWDSKRRGDAYFSKEFPIKVKNEFFKHAFENSDYSQMPEDYKQFVLQADSHNLSAAWSENSAILIPSLTGAFPSESDAEILKRFAKVFEQAYIRFMDLQVKEEQSMALINEKKRLEKTLTDLKATQKQLIQSEKMASLGELTAGIAHEIQNPLNFVNNFSEVSGELIDEMNEEIEKGDIEEVKFIAKDIKENLEKINHHGKRAEGIVKGMLQHSRSGSGKKEPTNINTLADEYLRLAYHGLRAKDKSFNATLETHFDDNLGNLNIIPQDIGRVILNLITNAFYVVDEKKKSGIENYEPTVSVSTKKLKDQIIISVKDNGNGIPKHILDKIFQPFFTTKPTGQGTGLGLSMSYDIIHAHGGELKVETKDGAGTIFSIILTTTTTK